MIKEGGGVGLNRRLILILDGGGVLDRNKLLILLSFITFIIKSNNNFNRNTMQFLKNGKTIKCLFYENDVRYSSTLSMYLKLSAKVVFD